MKKPRKFNSTEEFIKAAQMKHGNKYDYSKTKYINKKTKIIIICKKHGEFTQRPLWHLDGGQCKKCSCKTRTPTDEFIKRAKKVHGDKFDYSLVDYQNLTKKVKIICPKHGLFEQRPQNHLRQTCPECSKTNKLDQKEFIKRARAVHGNKYDYSKSNYINCYNKVEIICKKHGSFRQSPRDHWRGRGCCKCAKSPNRTTESFVEEARIIHNDKYDYSKIDYKNIRTKLTIICPKHGEFKQTPPVHLKSGCPQCADHSLNTEEFIHRARAIHDNKYDYSKSNYANYSSKITIICPIHGEFEQSPSNHLSGKGCNLCPAIISSGHQEVIDYVQSIYNQELKINDRKQITPNELDIYIPKESLAIEFNGIFYHSYDHNESTEERNKHKTKHLKCMDKSIDLIQINEREWLEKPDIIKSIIANKLGKSNRMYARKCKISQIDKKTHKQFMKLNHISGDGKSPFVAYGLFTDDKLVSVMSFSKHNKHEWEINRFATILNHTVIGGASKLFKHFVSEYKPNQTLTYADARFGQGNVYKKLGFEPLGMTQPGYCYVNGTKHYNRQKFQKHKLKDQLENFDPTLTEAENMFNHGFRRLWDAGHYRYLYKNSP